MARKRSTRREKGAGSYYYDKTNQRHKWTLEHDGKRYQVADRDEARAKAQFEDLKRKIFGGVDISEGRQTLQAYLPTYIANEVAPQLKRTTAHNYQKRADYYILPTLGDYRLCDLKRPVLVAWVNAMLDSTSEAGKQWSLHSIRQALRLLQRCLASAVDNRWIEDNPAASVKVPRRRKGDELLIDEHQTEQKVFTPEQYEQFMAEVKRTNTKHGLHTLYLLMADLTPRRGEALGIRRKDIDFEQQIISIRQQVVLLDTEVLITTPKTQKGRRDIPIPDSLVTPLRAQCLRVGAAHPDDLVFPDKDRQPRNPGSISQHFRRVCKRLGFTGYTLHSLRKYAITDMRRHGADAETTAAIAGHSVNVMADIYSDPQMDRKRTAIKKGRKTE